jgi:cell division protein FtsW
MGRVTTARGAATTRARRRPRGGLRLRLPGGVPPEERPSTYWLLLALTGVLLVIGLVMVLSASSVQSLAEFGSTWVYFVRQVMWVLIGVVAMVVASRVDYRLLRRLSVPLLIGSLCLLVVVLVPGIGISVNGARAWLGAGPMRMQPSELVKLALLLFSCDLLARRHDRMHDARLTLVPILVVMGVTAFLMMLQPDLGSTMVMGAIVFAVLFVAGVPLLRLTGVFTGGSALALGLALAAPYRRNRLLAFLDPSRDPMNTGYQINQSLVGLASGGLFGVGLGESRSKYGFLPNAHTDFIFAIISEELGLVGALIVVVLFLGVATLGVKAALRAPDRFGMLLAAGITAWILAQALVNIGGVIGLMPITGLTLPFISSGGSSLVVTLASTGILLNVAAQGTAPARAKSRPESYRSRSHPAMRPRPAPVR